MTTLRLFVIVLLATGLAACGQQASAPPAAPPSGQPARPVSSAPPGGFGVTEQAFVQLAIATDDQAVKLLDLGAARVAEPTLRDLASDLAAARRDELTALHGLLDSASIPYENLHQGHDMPGMPTEPELAALRTSADFDAEFARLVRAHLTESTTVARSAAEQVTHAGTKAVATGMVDERRAALARLDGLG
ncbi:DUF305 domain-containing protein [Actinophytocola gossypii]|uniref:DUF305 domain-containing protein n=1 Tax=Actinophytocola gossypii TaxID=2812003 RepID=A0ABT2JJV7_9PSEU|nr:DUF305 domain-containing protein [Actinophytocola gossypii]MCT2587665.1 DUF305 domain-containing protein [Actinophytocola gossypii]